jgi:HB1, ASXL, restriction endonuclease HTH domain
MARDDLLSIIKAKQAQIAKLRAELEEAQTLLVAIVRRTTAPARGVRRRHPRRRSAKMLEHSPTAREAAKILRGAGRPLHATAIAKILTRHGNKVALGTLVSTLSRWVQSRSVFYRVRPNVFGLISQRRGARGGRSP